MGYTDMIVVVSVIGVNVRLIPLDEKGSTLSGSLYMPNVVKRFRLGAISLSSKFPI